MDEDIFYLKMGNKKFWIGKEKLLLIFLVCIIFSSTVVIVEGTDRGSGTAGTSEKEYDELDCRNSNDCSEIDSVWSILLTNIGFDSIDSTDSFWNPYDGEEIIGEWMIYSEKYPEFADDDDDEEECDDLEIDYSKLESAFSTSTLDSDFKENLIAMSDRLGVNYIHLLAVMKFESSLNPAAVNDNPYTDSDGEHHPEGTQATGLIQFLPSTASSSNIGTTVEALREMTASEQLPYVEKYYQSKITRDGFRGDNLGDVAMAVISPATIGESDDKIMYSDGSSAYNANKPLDIDDDGDITRGEYITFVINKAGFYVSDGDCSSTKTDDSSTDTEAPTTSSAVRISSGDKIVVVIGASNTAGDSYVDGLASQISPDGYSVYNSGIGGNTPSKMLERFDTDVLAYDPEIVIIEPSINGITSTTSYTNAVVSMAQLAKSSGAKVVVLSNSPHKWFNYCGGISGDTPEERWASKDCSSRWSETWQTAIEEFNDNLLNNELGIPSDIDYVINIYDILEDEEDDDVCSGCTSDNGHFGADADGIVASKIYRDVFH